ncbi:MAG: hypothetical protein FWC57_00935 [Endomicrobia bacterium]|nr:hypothetical protein [Endomicrobiia bacterium]
MIKKTAAVLIALTFCLAPLFAAMSRKKVVSGNDVFYVYYDEKGAEVAKEKILKNGSSEFVYGFKINGEVKETGDNGVITYMWSYKDNKKNGPCYRFYPSGKKMEEFTYKNGVLDGPSKKYSEDGKVTEAADYVNGKISTLENFLENGNRWKYSYKNDKLNGTSYLYDSQNRLIESKTYKDNVLNGSSKKYYLSSAVKSETEYVNGKPEGYSHYYDEKGREVSTVLYKNGKEVNKIRHLSEQDADQSKTPVKASLEKSGGQKSLRWQGPASMHMADSKRMINEIKFFVKDGGNMNGVFKAYYKNGQTRYEGRFANGRPEGIFKAYSPEGKVVSADNYSRGRINGTSKLYYLSGEKLAEYRYKDGVLEGVSSVYNKDGSVLSQVSYRKGLMHGTIKNFYDNKGLCFEGYFSDGEPVGQIRYYFYGDTNKLQYLIEFNKGRMTKSTAFSRDGFVSYEALY